MVITIGEGFKNFYVFLTEPIVNDIKTRILVFIVE
jgi:hypothetical protein